MAAGGTTRAAMSDDHKAALAKGREQGRVVRKYLEALEAHSPRRGRKPDPERMRVRLEAIEAEIEQADPLTRLHLAQERMDLRAQVGAEGVDGEDTLAELEEEFIRVAADYSASKGLTREAWRGVGVAAGVLRRAGIS